MPHSSPLMPSLGIVPLAEVAVRNRASFGSRGHGVQTLSPWGLLPTAPTDPDVRRVGRQRVTRRHFSNGPPQNRSGDFQTQAARQLTNIHSGQVVVHCAPFPFEMCVYLSPFAMWPAFPTADYYEDSVTLGLASVRPSRVPVVLNVSSVT